MESLLPGLRGMLNWHPVFVHFPIAFWLGALLFEALSLARGNDEWHRTALRLLWLGTLAGLLAVYTGLEAEMAVPEAGDAWAVAQTHKRLMLLATSAAVGLSLWAAIAREKLAGKLRWAFFFGLVVLAVLLTLGADRGAQLVYHYGTAVDWSKAVPQR
jgi:uncharacterized membrane protein